MPNDVFPSADEVDRLRAELNAALTIIADGAYADACKGGGDIYQHALALTVEKFRGAEKERDEAKAYLKAFVYAAIDPEDEQQDGQLHKANPSLGWIFTLDDMDVCPQRHILGSQIRRAMEIVGYDKLKIEPPGTTLADDHIATEGALRELKGNYLEVARVGIESLARTVAAEAAMVEALAELPLIRDQKTQRAVDILTAALPKNESAPEIEACCAAETQSDSEGS